MALVCSISGQVPEDPVVSPVGRLFEKRTVLKALRENGGVCPVSGEPLSADDLISIQVHAGIKPRPVTATSIPGLLQIFQNEWDSLMLETFQLKKQLDQTRQELTHALYQHDAACRVIARVTKERDDARNLLHHAESRLANAQYAAASSAQAEQMEVDAAAPPSLSDAVVQNISAVSADLSAARKKRVISSSLVSGADLAQFSSKKNVEVHKSGITCLDVVDNDTRRGIIATGGLDHAVALVGAHDKTKPKTLAGHAKAVSCVRLHPTANVVVSASEDRTVRVWKQEGKDYECADVLKHNASVASVTIHPTNDYFASIAADGTWALYDFATLKPHAIVDAKLPHGFTAGSFHPDGLILGTATKDNLVRIWDVKSLTNVVTFAANAAVSRLSFSENGYHLALGGGADGVSVWDLRKVARAPTSAAPLFVSRPEGTSDASDAAFDYSGSYLAVGGTSIKVLTVKTWEEVASFAGDSAPITGLGFGKDASFVASASKSGKLHIYS